MEVEIKNFNSNLEKHVEEQREDFKTVFEKLDRLDGKFANKWVEKAIIALSLGITITVIGGVLLFLLTR